MYEDEYGIEDPCILAIMAATDVIIDYCPDNHADAIRFNLVALSLLAPPKIVQIVSNTDLTRDERIKLISEDQWSKDSLHYLHTPIAEKIDPEAAAVQVAAMIVYSVYKRGDI
jgi:hypothetical protein